MAQKINDNTRKSFNGEPIRAGEVLVPQFVDDKAYAISLGAKPENLRTWSKGGVQYMVMFVPVPVNQEKICQQAFDAAVNDYLDEKLGPNRYSRCLIPQPDGTKKVCPKIKNGNHAPCATCPHRGEYEREDRSMASIEMLNEEEYHPMEAAPSAESESLMKLMFNDLKDYLHDISPALEDVVTLGFEGFDRNEVVQHLPVKKSQAYTTYDKAEKLTREFLFD
ncbi:MAG: hypothetical protein IJ242_12735 [Clostridia bacterium]|nr:hypothetical protein [Clostridia bacterium]